MFMLFCFLMMSRKICCSISARNFFCMCYFCPMHKIRFFLVFIIGFAVYFFIDANFFSLLQKEIIVLTQSRMAGHVFAYAITIIPLLITVALLRKEYQNLPEKLGLSKGLLVGFVFAFLSTLPMLVAYAIKFGLNKGLSFDTFIINTISAAFFEEIIYRAFLFGMLYRYTRLGFLPAVFLGSLLFGIVHLYQSTDVNELIGIFLLTFLGSVLFAWVYAEWNFNLWSAIFLHCLMNVYWLIFEVDNTALGGTYANIFRFASIFLAILVTLFYKRRKKITLEIKGKKLWVKSKGNADF